MGWTVQQGVPGPWQVWGLRVELLGEAEGKERYSQTMCRTVIQITGLQAAAHSNGLYLGLLLLLLLMLLSFPESGPHYIALTGLGLYRPS